MTTPEVQNSVEIGREARRMRQRSAMAELLLKPDRDPVGLTSADDADRLQWLLPERYRRMSVTPFTFYRGSAAVMASDLGGMPNSGIFTQLCGDAHMSNFGVYASPERELLFDLNDFDESSPGPFEWDVQRLAASAVLAARDSKFDKPTQRLAAQTAVSGYHEAMRRYADLSELEVWYERVPTERFMALATSAAMRKRIRQSEAKARGRDAASAVAKLTEVFDGRLRLRNDPPLLLRLDDLTDAGIAEGMAEYRESLSPDRRALVDRFEVIDVAHKVVGVGSVGTRCLIVLLLGRERGEPLLLQFKEAGASVLEPYAGPSEYHHHGHRVVSGQRLMQAASDIFLGWTTSQGRDFYWRQLRDMKWSPDLATLKRTGLPLYAGVCGATLARAHARSGNRVAIASYLGGGESFVNAVTRFAFAYADQAEADYVLMKEALLDGRLPTDDDLPVTVPKRRAQVPNSFTR